MMNNFFDCLNVRVTNEAPLIENGRVNKKRNPFVEPFKTVDDFRFTWLTQDFLQYFENWLRLKVNQAIILETRRQKCSLHVRHEGIKITVHSVVELHNFYLKLVFPMF